MHKILTFWIFIISIIGLFTASGLANALPTSFAYAKNYIPSLQEDMRYYTSNNFIGHPIKGYHAPRCILTRETAIALQQVQNDLKKYGLGLRVYDCYRPQSAVDEFVQWSQDAHDQMMKQAYYPRINKSQLFKQNYIAKHSGHSRGSTVDLTLVNLKTNRALDMGTRFDFLDPLSHPDCRFITPQQYHNRMLLRHAMIQHGFKPLYTEWWHFTLIQEPFKNDYFNFLVN